LTPVIMSEPVALGVTPRTAAGDVALGRAQFDHAAACRARLSWRDGRRDWRPRLLDRGPIRDQRTRRRVSTLVGDRLLLWTVVRWSKQ
jgi:hypothetical protein